ncbi:MAG: alpha/beta hydrolase superfamily protein [Amphiamblys sp. WSBS2006]|nr:MAG: alpha/beta hydrolase superfamily protein [Amphiamblys sp. WSBS2006]
MLGGKAVPYAGGLFYFDTHPETDQAVVLVGGLGNLLFFYSFTERMAEEMRVAGFSVVLPFLSSTGSGFGTSSLKKDAEELSKLLSVLSLHGKKKAVLLGHSTGCQSILRLLNDFPEDPEGGCAVCGAVLQAPVSDADYFSSVQTESDGRFLSQAHRMVAEGCGCELMPVDAFMHTPITAERYLSINTHNLDDDYFSRGISRALLSEKICRVRKKVLLVFSGNDEYVPAGVSCSEIGEGFKALSSLFSYAVLDGADHAITENKHCQQDVFISRLLEFALAAV